MQLTVDGGGITTMEEHEATTWPVVVNAPALPTAPTTTRDMPTLLTYMRRMLARRGGK
jgi:hypothetical protein